MESATLSLVGTHEGKRLKDLIKAHGITADALAQFGGVSAGAVSKWFKEETIGDRAWMSAARALKAAGIDPQQIRAAPIILARDKGPPAIDLRPLIDGFDRRQMESLRRVLRAPDADRERLLFWLDGKLD